MSDNYDDVDSDEDLYGYFLQPASAYNMTERIKEANQELFDEGIEEATQVKTLKLTNSKSERRVSFRENLEDFQMSCRENMKLTPQAEIHEKSPQKTAEFILSNEHRNITEEITLSDGKEKEIEEICEEIVAIDVASACFNTSDTLDCTATEKREAAPKIIWTEPLVNRNATEDSSADAPTSDDEDLSVIYSSYAPDEERNRKFFTSIIGSPKSDPPIRRRRRSNSSSKGKEQASVSEKMGNILKLRLNHKICCVHKKSEELLPPRYNGYMTEYGLTKEQWHDREQRHKRIQNRFIEQRHRAAEEKKHRSEDNERAFTKWLRNKMRFPIKKTRNMFDYKLRPRNFK